MTRTKERAPGRRKRVVQSLRDLSLAEEDLAGLRRQGSVCREPRGEATYYKLRFRSADGRQHVHYLGQDATIAAQIQTELEGWQRLQRQLQALKRCNADARKLLRRAKQQVCSGLEVYGYHFHGFEIRRRRAGVEAAGVGSQSRTTKQT